MPAARTADAARPGPAPATRALVAALAAAAAWFLWRHALPRFDITPAAYGDYYWPRRTWLVAHLVGGLAATLLGPSQFVQDLRRARPALHRRLGWLYLVAVGTSALSALYLAATSAISTAYTVGLVLVASLWLGTGWQALCTARAQRFGEHRAWMIRNYTLTFFFILFFALYDALAALGMGPPERLATLAAWVCWLVPAALVEGWLRTGRRARPA